MSLFTNSASFFDSLQRNLAISVKFRENRSFQRGVQAYKEAEAAERIARETLSAAQVALDGVKRSLGRERLSQISSRHSVTTIEEIEDLLKELISSIAKQPNDPETVQQVEQAKILIDRCNLSARIASVSLSIMRECLEEACKEINEQTTNPTEKRLIQTFLERIQNALPTRQQIIDRRT